MSSLREDATSPIVLLVDDDPSVLRSLRRFFGLAGYRTQGFESPLEFLALPVLDTDGCVVTDLRMPGLSGLELQQAAREKGWTLPFLFLTGHGEVPDAVRALKEGAVDFLQKPVDPPVLLEAVQLAVAAGQHDRKRRRESEQARWLLSTLTTRERQVVDLIGQGLLNKQIAAELGTAEKTVKIQRGRAMRKLMTSTPAALVDLLRRAGS